MTIILIEVSTTGTISSVNVMTIIHCFRYSDWWRQSSFARSLIFGKRRLFKKIRRLGQISGMTLESLSIHVVNFWRESAERNFGYFTMPNEPFGPVISGLFRIGKSRTSILHFLARSYVLMIC